MNKYLMNHRFLGVVFVGMLVLGVWLVNAVFTQKFVSFDRVTLDTSTVGLQLPEKADVKVRGVIVGQVTKMQSKGQGAVLELGIKPEQIGSIPANVSAAILPKTLFGEKFVELDHPQGPLVGVAEGGRQDQADQAPDRGGASPERPLPAAADRPAGGAELHAQRPRQRPRRAAATRSVRAW